MRVSKSSDHWCAFGKMSNFEKRSLRSGHLMRPGHVTFGVIGSSFFRKCVKLLAEQLWQIWRRYVPPFFRYLRKTVRGGWNQPPPRPVRGLRLFSVQRTVIAPASASPHLGWVVSDTRHSRDGSEDDLRRRLVVSHRHIRTDVNIITGWVVRRPGDTCGERNDYVQCGNTDGETGMAQLMIRDDAFDRIACDIYLVWSFASGVWHLCSMYNVHTSYIYSW